MWDIKSSAGHLSLSVKVCSIKMWEAHTIPSSPPPPVMHISMHMGGNAWHPFKMTRKERLDINYDYVRLLLGLLFSIRDGTLLAISRHQSDKSASMLSWTCDFSNDRFSEEKSYRKADLAARRRWRLWQMEKGEPSDKVSASSEFGFGGILVSTCQDMRKEKRRWTEKRQYSDAVGLWVMPCSDGSDSKRKGLSFSPLCLHKKGKCCSVRARQSAVVTYRRSRLIYRNKRTRRSTKEQRGHATETATVKVQTKRRDAQE